MKVFMQLLILAVIVLTDIHMVFFAKTTINNLVILIAVNSIGFSLIIISIIAMLENIKADK